MKQNTKNWLIIFGLLISVIVLSFINSANATDYRQINIHNHYNVTNVTNLTGVSQKDLATVSAMAGAASQHHFTNSIKRWQGSIAGACHDSSADDCGISFAVAKRHKDLLFSGSISGASNERLYGGSIGFTW